MTIKDLHDNVRTKTVVIPKLINTPATHAGLVIDRQGYGGVEFLIAYGSITTTGTVVAVVVKEGDVTGTLTSVADADLLGTEALAGLAAATPRSAGTTKEVTKRVGYKGNKRYVSVDLVNSGVTSAAMFGCMALLHSPYNAPTANP